MDRDQLLYFVQAAESLNFSEVAKKNYLTQPAISRHIAKLEQQLGVNLFLRIGHTVRLTGEGEMFLTESRKILRQMEDASISVRRLAEGKSGKLSIGMVNTSSFVLQKCLRAFSTIYPDIQLTIKVMQGGELEKAIHGNEFDFYFTDEHMLPYSGYNHTVTGHDRFHLILPSSYPLDSFPDLSTLHGEPFVAIDILDAPGLHRLILEICSRRSFVPHIVSSYSRMEAVMISVTAGLGISILPSVSEMIFAPLGTVKSFPIPGDDCKLTSVIIWGKDMTNPAARKFLDVALQLYPLK